MRVIGYVRVSTNEQAQTGVSLAAQEQQIRAYCKGNGWLCIGIIRDDGASAKDLKNPGLQQLLAEVPQKSRRFAGIVVTKLDRAANADSAPVPLRGLSRWWREATSAFETKGTPPRRTPRRPGL